MKRLISIAVLSLAVVGLSVASFAQQTGGVKQDKKQGAVGHRGHAKMKLAKKHMAEKLNLTAEQKQRVQILHDQTKARLQALKNSPGDRTSKAAKFKEIREASRTEFQSILTSDQKAKLQEMKKNLNDRLGKRQGGKRDGKTKRGGGIGA